MPPDFHNKQHALELAQNSELVLTPQYFFHGVYHEEIFHSSEALQTLRASARRPGQP